MIIQSGYGALAYSSIGTSAMQRQNAKPASAIIAAPENNAAPGNSFWRG